MNKVVNLKLKVQIKEQGKPESRIASVSTVLGPRGIKPIEFLRKFDDQGARGPWEAGRSVIVRVQAVMDGNKAASYNFQIYGYDMSSYLKHKLGITKFPGKHTEAEAKWISDETLQEIVNDRIDTVNSLDRESATRTIISTLLSYNVRVHKKV